MKSSFNSSGDAQREAAFSPVSKVLVIGLDGASWTLLDPLIRDGRLPNIAKLISNGTRSVLESTIPPVTASAWSSFYTGRTPGCHGVFDFRKRMGLESTKREWVTHCSIHGPKLWEIVAAQGKTVGLVNLPLTFPPSEVNGYVISGMPVPPTRDDIGLPAGIIGEVIRETGEYISDIDLLRGESPNVTDPDTCHRFVDQVDKALKSRIKAIGYLMDSHPSDLTTCVLIAPDRLSHLFWKVMVPEKTQAPLEKWEDELRGKMFDVLARMDSGVGELAGRMSDNDLIVIMSDHGFGPLDDILKLNRLLADLGYLKFKPEVEGGIRRKVGRILPESVKKPLRNIFGHGAGMTVKPGERKEFDPYSLIDWPNTRAYSGGSVEQGIFLNVIARDPHGTIQMGGDYHKLRDELILALKKAVNPLDNTPLFDWVEPRENIYTGMCLEAAPDIIYSLRGYTAVIGEDAEPPLMGKWSQPRAGYHRREGVLIAQGPMIRKGQILDKAKIEDIAPTVLACWGLAADKEMDGNIVNDMIEPGFLEAVPPKWQNFASDVCAAGVGDEDSAEMEDLLKGLGYLS